MAFKNRLRRPKNQKERRELVSRDFFRRQQQSITTGSSCLQLVDANGFDLIDANGFNLCVSS